MTILKNVHTPQPLKINGLWQFFPEMAYQEGEPDSPPLGPFRVLGDYVIKRGDRDVSVTRFLILKPEEGCIFPVYNEYAIEYPEKLIAANIINIERKGRVHRIRAQLNLPNSGFKFCQLHLKNEILPVREYVIYEEQVEGTWIPVEVDGRELKP